MPYPDPDASNAHWFTYEGVDIYIERRDQHKQEPLTSFWYSTSSSIGSPERFDVRELTESGGVTVKEMAEGNADPNAFDNEATETSKEDGFTMHRSAGRDKHREIIKRAIDDGTIS